MIPDEIKALYRESLYLERHSLLELQAKRLAHERACLLARQLLTQLGARPAAEADLQAQTLATLQALPPASADRIRLQKLLPGLEQSDKQDRAQLEALRLRLLSLAKAFGHHSLAERCRVLADAGPDALLADLLAGITEHAAPPDRQWDALTGLPSRVRLAERFEQIQLLARHHDSPFCLALLMIQDNSQAEQGQELTGQWPSWDLSHLQALLPETASLCRWQAKGLLILLPNLSLEDARQRLETFMHDAQAAWHGSLIPVTPSQLFASCVLEAWQWAVQNPQGLISPEPRSAHVVIVDDDAIVIELMVYLLEKQGWRATALFNGDQLLELLAHETVELLILDIMIPGCDGFELLSRIRSQARFASLPIVMLSALRHEHALARSFELGADDYLYKPFSPEEVLIRLRHLLAQGQQST